MPESFLERIVAATRMRLAERMTRQSLEDVLTEARQQPPALDFATALRPRDGGVRAIAEFKRASPSKGIIREHASPRFMARKYVAGGAAAISVLTEEDHFQGSLDDLRAVKRSYIAGETPVLRKDFITDAYQVAEARAAGADSFLLIVALLDDATLAALMQFGRELGMEPLVEAHDAEEAQRAVRVGAQIIGVNARDLRTFQVDTTRLRDIRPLIPADRIVVAESGINTMSDVARMRGYGAQAILVGETLMRAKRCLRDLIALPPVLRKLPAKPRPIVKLCGMRAPADALAAYEAGADMIGLVFAPSKRQVSVAQAREIVRALPDDALTVGVFLAEDCTQRPFIEETIAATGITMAQLCGVTNAGGEFRGLPVPTIRARYRLQVTRQSSTEPPHLAWRTFPSIEPLLFKEHSLPLYEAAPYETLGGAGLTGDWEDAANAAREFPMILAGGLTPENVSDAIRAVLPWGVDVSSGIEGADGMKDPARMRAFVHAVRGMENTHDH